MQKKFSDLPDDIAAKALAHPALRGLRRRPRVFVDTSDFTSIDYGDILWVDERFFLIIAYTREGRFGVDDQPKQWVPKVVELSSGVTYIIKLVFHETFEITFGKFKVTCYRSPEKEARILELVRGHERFMQGYGVEDEAGNLVRILDIIRGWRLDKYIHRFKGSHEEYFNAQLPAILKEFVECVKAIGLIHAHGMRHGDIRRDHIFVEFDTGLFRWIDFDYDFYLPERPFSLDLFELGNILLYLIGRGNFYPNKVLENPAMGRKVFDLLNDNDISLLSKNRIVNLKKLFPYIPKPLNDIVMHFAQGTPVFYDTVSELANDLEGCLITM
ncbi:MAG TPA: serine/threonine protein kinase [Desulfobacterales bacterium]|nr:serine/threonine protein kinase [Desulfobacterales bacterium]